MDHLSSAETMAMLKEQREGCGGVCSNGGQCRNGECVCRSGWEGQFCDEEEEGVAAELIWFFIITVILVIAFVIWKQGEWLKKKLADYQQARGNAGGNAG